MKKENQASVSFVKANKIGAPVFFRYSFVTNEQFKESKVELLKEVFDWMISIEELKLLRVFATHSKNEEVLLVTLAFEKQIMANIFLATSSTKQGFQKKFEVVGTEGMYVYDSTHTLGFTSDCCEIKEYQLEETLSQHDDWLNLVEKSLKEKKTIFAEEVF